MTTRILASQRRATLAVHNQRQVDRVVQAANAANLATAPTGSERHAILRGIPVVGACRGTSPGTDPVQALLGKENRA